MHAIIFYHGLDGRLVKEIPELRGEATYLTEQGFFTPDGDETIKGRIMSICARQMSPRRRCKRKTSEIVAKAARGYIRDQRGVFRPTDEDCVSALKELVTEGFLEMDIRGRKYEAVRIPL